MKAAPAVSVSIEAHGASALCVALVCAWALLVTALWAWQGGHVVWVAGSVSIVIASAWSFLRWFRKSAQRLSWDGQQWFLGVAGATVGTLEPVERGRVAVAIDLGTWVLLRFRREEAAFAQRPAWLVLRRSQAPGQWHSLRCALYSPDPSPSAGELLARG